MSDFVTIYICPSGGIGSQNAKHFWLDLGLILLSFMIYACPSGGIGRHARLRI